MADVYEIQQIIKKAITKKLKIDPSYPPQADAGGRTLLVTLRDDGARQFFAITVFELTEVLPE
jgi:hypothetical protein